MKKCLFSVHIPKVNIDGQGQDIMDDIRLFNTAKHKAFTLIQKDKDVLKTSKDTGKPDMRLKENKKLRGQQPKSIHVQIKELYGLNDYFANSAKNEASAVIRSVLELQKDYIRDKKDALKKAKKKLTDTRRSLTNLERLHKEAKELCQWLKKQNGRKPRIRLPKGSLIHMDRDANSFHIRKPFSNEAIAVYDNPYLFDVRYLRPEIRKLKNREHSLIGKVKKMEASIKRLEEAENPSVCFGSKDFFRKQDTVYEGAHGTWKYRFRKIRNHGMTISGRKDSRDGNYVFRYDPDTFTLTYKRSGGSKVYIPGVRFPYGQKLLNDFLLKQKEGKSGSIAWRIEDWGGSFIIKCTFDMPVDHDKDYYYGDGCVGMDCNVDCFAVSETNRDGNLIRHFIVPFDLRGLSSGQSEQVLSKALEQVFQYCWERHKPLVMEDLKDVAKTDHYGSKVLNRTLSSFAHTKMHGLAVSKSFKYGVDVKFVNPAYTSQMGKAKYMSRYGLSVHESAALVIARRGMGFKEKLPKVLLPKIPKEKVARHHWSHWRHIHGRLKEIPINLFYIGYRYINKSHLENQQQKA